MFLELFSDVFMLFLMLLEQFNAVVKCKGLQVPHCIIELLIDIITICGIYEEVKATCQCNSLGHLVLNVQLICGVLHFCSLEDGR